jgi:phospholipid/cholesterol/gamma-HCH transport system substrate-binding protein
MKTKKQLPPKALGVVVIVLFLLVGWVAFQKEAVHTFLFTQFDETIEAEFGGRAKLIDDSLTYVHQVKLDGVIVGKVIGIEETDRGTMLATLRVDRGTRAKLGSAPTAAIRPTLVTDGVQNVLLSTGGQRGVEFTEDRIPLERTQLPVALDDVLTAVSSDAAVKGIRSFIDRSDATLAQGGGQAIRGLVSDAPQTLRPAGVVLSAFRGTQPDVDLNRLVVGFEHIAAAMNKQPGQFSRIVRDLDATTTALGDSGRPLSQALSTGDETLRVTRAGMADLRPALDRLRVTAEDFQPSARSLDGFLQEFQPTLHRARPVFDDLRGVLKDLRPTLRDLDPIMDKGDHALDGLKGPVFDRVNGPIKDRLYSPLKGENEYSNSASDFPFYQEIGYLFSDASSVWQHYDSNNAIARLEAGGGGQTFGGTKFPSTVEQYMEAYGLQRPVGPQEQHRKDIPKQDQRAPDRPPFTALAPKSGSGDHADEKKLPSMLKSPLGGDR